MIAGLVIRPGASVRRGAALIAALLLCSVVLSMGVAMVYTQSRGYSTARARFYATQARLLAQAGIQDVVMKLAKDPRFPPMMGGRKLFSLAERVLDPEDPATTVGTYYVTLDVSRRSAPAEMDRTQTATYDYPNFTIRIRSDGTAMHADGRRMASHRIDAELDVSPKTRGASVTGDLWPGRPSYYTNRNYFRFLRWEDSGSL